MNYPIWDLPAPGLLIAAIAILHVFISHFAVGGGLFLVVAESRARAAGDSAMLAFLKDLTRFFVLLTLVLGAITGVGIWFTIALVHPQATSALLHIFVWGWAIEWTMFLTEIAAALVYHYGWERLPARAHLAVGWIYFAAAWGSLAVIDGILSFMLTAGDWPQTRSLLDAFFNPGYLPTVVLRTAVAACLAGLYTLLAGSFVRDPELKGRIARHAGFAWVIPGAAIAALSLVWYLAVLQGAGVPVAEALGAKGTGTGALLSAALSLTPRGGQPLAQNALFATLVGSCALVALTLALVALRARRYRPAEAALLMLAGFVVMGGGEWGREALRKPWVIDRYLFTNGVRLPMPPGAPAPPSALGMDPFTPEALDASGVLAATPWTRMPQGVRPDRTADATSAAGASAELEAAAGAEVFRLLCASCHTPDGYLAIRPLVAGKPAAALDRIVRALARPVNASGEPTGWNDPDLRLSTWLGRRMPPFTGTEAERRALCLHLARLGGDATTGLEVATPPRPEATVEISLPASSPSVPAPAAESPVSAPAPDPRGPALFEEQCAMCHGGGSDWPMKPRVRGKSGAELFTLLARLPELNEAMPAFEGTEEERRALADHLERIGKE